MPTRWRGKRPAGGALDRQIPNHPVSRAREAPAPSQTGGPTWIRVEGVHTTRTGQARLALLICVARGVLRRGDRVVCLTGPDGSNRIDTAMVLDLGTESELFPSLGDLDLGGDFSAEVFERVLWIASRIAAEGREGRPIGTIFVLVTHLRCSPDPSAGPEPIAGTSRVRAKRSFFGTRGDHQGVCDH